MTAQNNRRVIEINRGVIGPAAPRPSTVLVRQLSDYPHVPAVYRDVARLLSSPLRMGPPICDELMAFVQHLFTEEEAGVARHLRQYRGRRAADLAMAEHRPIEQVEPILRRLADEKRIIAASGRTDEDRTYRLLPIMPGIFEMALIGQNPETLSDWHRRFIELFEAMQDTGYASDYGRRQTPFVRFFTVGKAIEAHPMALPSDKLEIVLDQYEAFGVGNCQCRMSMQVIGRGCGKPLGNCMAMGQWAERGIEQGYMRPVTKREAIEIKREAESHGLVNWMMNVESPKGQCSCSCCGCCCHAMRMVNEFNAPACFAPPHFLPQLDESRCLRCGKCAQNCPMGAIIVDTQQKTIRHLAERCIGCGLCVLACDRQRALAMQPVPDYRLPYRSWFSLIAHTTPGTLLNSWTAWRKRSL
ncbi:MAG: 4Fe-4S dicluster-binding protein [Thermoguttaceae bacterium]